MGANNSKARRDWRKARAVERMYAQADNLRTAHFNNKANEIEQEAQRISLNLPLLTPEQRLLMAIFGKTTRPGNGDLND